MITGEISFQIWAQDNNTFRMIVENSVKKKTHPEHKYSVTFVSKVGTISFFQLLFDEEKHQSSSAQKIGFYMETSFRYFAFFL